LRELRELLAQSQRGKPKNYSLRKLSRSKKEREKMATTARELIEILQKYTKPDEVIIWQYYTAEHFDYDENQPAPTQKQFAKIADRVERWELWTEALEGIQEAIYELQQKGKK
jgi:hypothetical protein